MGPPDFPDPVPAIKGIAGCAFMLGLLPFLIVTVIWLLNHVSITWR